MPGGKTTLDYSVNLNDGHVIPSLGVGTVFPSEQLDQAPDVIKTAIKSGLRHIDTAWYYGSEPAIGKALKELFDEGVVKREDLFITSKVWPSLWNNAEYSVKTSLSDLGVEYLDLVLQHWPVVFKGCDNKGQPKVPSDDHGKVTLDEEADYLETYKQLVELKKTSSLIRSVGVSNYTEKHIKRAIDETGEVPVINQVELHPRLPQKQLVEYCEEQGVKVEAYSPLGSQGGPLVKEPIVQKFAKKYNVSENSVLYSYHILSGRVVVGRTSNVERIPGFLELAPLTPADISELEDVGIKDPKRFIQEDWGIHLGFDNWKTEMTQKR